MLFNWCILTYSFKCIVTTMVTTEYPTCNCKYNPTLTIGGGCIIYEKPPKGYMCHCWKPFWFTCTGKAAKCVSEKDKGCSGCLEKECCDPEGDCWGYAEKYSNIIGLNSW